MSQLFDPRFFGEAFVTLFVIMDPAGTIPVFLALTSGRTPRIRHRAAWQAVAVSLGVICSFAVFGQAILDYLGIGIPALQGAGGLLLLLVALQLLTGQAEDPQQVSDVNVALVPLGTPLLAGPGAIVATIVFVRRADGAEQIASLALAIIAVHLALLLFLRFSSVIIRVIRESGIVLVTRIAGLLLSAIAVQLIASCVMGFVAASR
ncbi:MAG: MarC family protein [Actinomycetota bacterium]|nr:MarC family protein [Actinomycetota bacterium]